MSSSLISVYKPHRCYIGFDCSVEERATAMCLLQLFAAVGMRSRRDYFFKFLYDHNPNKMKFQPYAQRTDETGTGTLNLGIYYFGTRYHCFQVLGHKHIREFIKKTKNPTSLLTSLENICTKLIPPVPSVPRSTTQVTS